MKKKMSKSKAIIVFIVMILVMVAAGYVLLFGIPGLDRGQAAYITQGLDLKGGVSITYEVSESNGDWDSEDLEDTLYKMEQRVYQFSTEAQAYIEGDDRITVEIPGETDANEVLDELGKPGSLYFCTDTDDTPTDEQLENEEYVEVDGVYYQVWVTGDEVEDAQGQTVTDSTTSASENVVSLTFNSDGTTDFANMTTEYVGETSYIIYDGEIISSPTIQEAITGGEAQIDGMDSLEEAQNLASNIRIGSLSLELDEISHKVESAKLGSDALSKCIQAGFIGIIIIMIFMLIVYRIPGIAASLALLTYLELMLLALNGFDLTLTLPGIAGIILNIGMAVDANVIIYARIREEIAKGKSVGSAIDTGFSKAKSAIIDGNITTLIAALVLLWRGSGTVRGFAQTLSIGIIIQLFTALVISRLFIKCLYNMGFDKPEQYGRENIKKVFKFVEKKTVCFIISAALIVVGVIGIIANGISGDAFNYSIEFKSGQSVTVEFSEVYSIDEFNDEIKPVLEDIVGSSEVQGQQDTDNETMYTIKTQQLSEEQFDEFKQVLIDDFGALDDESNFSNTMISSTVSSEMRQDAVIATIIAIICMLLYIWVRFRNIHFALAAVICLAHDVLIVVGFYGLSRVTVGTTFIACLLTIIGYSINATIVIFDRIRENRKLKERGETMKDVVNKSISQTLTRSIYTSITTFIAVFMIFIMGVTSIQEFTLPLMVGIVIGGYSSVFIAGSLWYLLKGRSIDKKEAALRHKTI